MVPSRPQPAQWMGKMMSKADLANFDSNVRLAGPGYLR